MKELLVTSHSPVELQSGAKEEKLNHILRAVEEVKPSDKHAEFNQQKSDAKDDGALIASLKENLTKLNHYIPVTSTNLSFEFDDKGDPPFIRVIDKGNNEVIREIPSKEFREVAKALDELADKLSSKGLLFDQTA